jgi:ankyrin repeat protein
MFLKGYTLNAACESNQFEIVLLLLEHGADPLQEDAVSLPSICCCPSLTLVSQSRHALTPLTAVCQSSSANVDIVSLLLSRGANVNYLPITDPPNRYDTLSPLHVACNVGNVEIVSRLLDAGADVNLKSVPVREPVPLSDS